MYISTYTGRWWMNEVTWLAFECESYYCQSCCRQAITGCRQYQSQHFLHTYTYHLFMFSFSFRHLLLRFVQPFDLWSSTCSENSSLPLAVPCPSKKSNALIHPTSRHISFASTESTTASFQDSDPYPKLIQSHLTLGRNGCRRGTPGRNGKIT